MYDCTFDKYNKQKNILKNILLFVILLATDEISRIRIRIRIRTETRMLRIRNNDFQVTFIVYY
jgi:hypothetical protein